MAEQLTPDLCVIGAGSGGLSVAAAAAALGVPVVLIENGKMGGDCLNAGCVPSKALIAAAKRAEAFRSGRVRHEAAASRGRVLPGQRPRPRGDRGDCAGRFPRSASPGSACGVIEGDARFKDAATVVAGERSRSRRGAS